MDFRGASDTRLMGTDGLVITEPKWDWSRDWKRLAARALNLVANDPFCAAMVQSKIDSTHGPEGLRAVSQAQYDLTKPVSDQDHLLREGIESGLADASGYGFDAQGLLTRKAFDRQHDWLATVMGESYAIRVIKPGRKRSAFSTCWRLVTMDRISNPDGRENEDRLYEGIEFDANGEAIAVWVETTKVGPFASYSERTWEKVDWFTDDGTPQVSRRVGWNIPGMPRAVSMFAPMLLMAKQIGGVIEAHVTAKRAQACIPVIYYVNEPMKAAAAARADSSSVVGPHTKFNPLQVYYAQFGSELKFTDSKFNGQDLDAFLKISYRVLCAVWQMPVEVVLCQMGEASLSSARAGLDQVDRTAQNWQSDHIEQASQIFDQATVSEMVYNGQITPGPSGRAGLNKFRYRRPPKYSTDRKKDADTIATLINDVKISKTTALSLFGLDHEDEVDQRIRDELYEQKARAAAGVPEPAPTTTAPAADPTPSDQPQPADQNQ